MRITSFVHYLEEETGPNFVHSRFVGVETDKLGVH